jgi:hypothetical protein
VAWTLAGTSAGVGVTACKGEAATASDCTITPELDSTFYSGNRLRIRPGVTSKGSKRLDIRARSAPWTAQPTLFTISVHVRVKPDISQPYVVSLHSTISPMARTLRIDLTSEVEHCAICLIKLREGSGKAGLVYVLKDCRCVSTSLLISCRFTNYKKVICGLCVQFPSAMPFLPCQHADHLSLGWQRPLRLYNLKCAICLDTDSSTRVSLVCSKFTPSIAVLANS